MIKKIATSSAYYGGGLSIQKKLFVVKSGPYQGRTAIVYPKNQSQLVFVWSDPPYTSWSEETVIVSDSANYPACAYMDDEGNIYVAYTVQTTFELAEKKLVYSDGIWNAGSKNVIYSGDANFYPSFYKDLWNRLWVSFTRESGGSYYINVKRSTNDGTTWGTGPTDEGTTLTSGSTSCYSQLVYRPNHVYCIYTEGGTKLAYSRMEITATLFDDEVGVYTGSGLSANFSGACSADLRLGIAFCDNSDLLFKEFDGAQWSGIEIVDSSFSVNPNLYYRQSVPYIVFAKEVGADQHQPHYSYREGETFSEAVPVSPEMSTFDRVFCYSPSGAVKFNDKTAAASDSTAADIYHDATGKMLHSVGDALYLGQSERFSMISVTLSTIGEGGGVAWYYWDGADWKVFTPYSGAYNVDSSPVTITLWNDTSEIPSDWQTCIVNGKVCYWIKASVSAEFTVAPIGSQLTGVPNVSYIISE